MTELEGVRLDKAKQDLQLINEKEPEVGTALAMVISHIAGTYSDKYAKGQKEGIDTKTMLYGEKSGKWINIYQVERYLQRYITEGSNKSYLIKDIEKAVHYLVFEITRRIRLQQTDETEPVL